MFLKLLLVLLLVFWFVPLLRRLLSGRPQPPPAPAGRKVPERDDRLADLTRQDISDADFEELPPEK